MSRIRPVRGASSAASSAASPATRPLPAPVSSSSSTPTTSRPRVRMCRRLVTPCRARGVAT